MTKDCLAIFVTLITILSLSACSKKGDQATVPNQAASSSYAASPQANSSPLEQPNLSTQASSYVDLTSGNQLMFLYYALSNIPPDFESMATNYSQDYRNTSDAFKKNDIMNVLKPQMLAAIETAKTQRYGIWTIDYAFIGHYDFNKKAFPLNSPFLANSSIGFFQDNGRYQIEFKNGDAFSYMPVADENVAKKIEELVSHGKQFTIKVYVFAQDANLSRRDVDAVITRADLLDKSGSLLASNQAK